MTARRDAPAEHMADETAVAPAIAVSGLRKRYGGIEAVAGVDLEIRAGMIHAIVGENGAGKSTLMKILAGAVRPDEGEIRVGGEPASFASPQEARAHGIGIVYQELSLFPERSVVANLFPDRQPTRRGLVDGRAMRERALPVLTRIGLRVDPDALVDTLELAERQLVEISRLLVERPRVLILDEPNSALNEGESQRLFEVLRELSASGVTIIYVSHLLEEVFSIAERITVMRNGRVVLTRDRRELTIPRVVTAMVGAEQSELFPPRRTTGSDGSDAAGDVDVRGLSVGTLLDDVSFTARRGEIVGLAGLEGSGVSTLLGILFGTRRPTSGSVRFPDLAGVPRSPTDAARRGISLVPADRQHQGLMLERSIVDNVAHVAVGTLPARRPWLDRRALVAAASRQIERLRIKAASPFQRTDRLSGGNQQKVVVGKWLEVAPRVMLLDDPTRGVDIGGKREMYLLIRRLADEGRIVLFRSTELPELVGLADRILVFYRGRLALEIKGDGTDERTVLHAINTGEAEAPDAHGRELEEIDA